jgi:mono/diheme cytochrome c family protein
MRRIAGAALAVVLSALVTGCGGAAGSDAVTGGAAIFARSCGGCHTLTGHDTHADGGDLALARLSLADIVSFTEVMPNRPRLSQADATSVAEYVRAVAQRVARSPAPNARRHPARAR